MTSKLIIGSSFSVFLLSADDDKRLAAAANAAMLKKLHTDARRDSKFVKKKLQRQLGPERGSSGSKQKDRDEVKQEEPADSGQDLLRRDSSQGGKPQATDSKSTTRKTVAEVNALLKLVFRGF